MEWSLTVFCHWQSPPSFTHLTASCNIHDSDPLFCPFDYFLNSMTCPTTCLQLVISPLKHFFENFMGHRVTSLTFPTSDLLRFLSTELLICSIGDVTHIFQHFIHTRANDSFSHLVRFPPCYLIPLYVLYFNLVYIWNSWLIKASQRPAQPYSGPLPHRRSVSSPNSPVPLLVPPLLLRLPPHPPPSPTSPVYSSNSRQWRGYEGIYFLIAWWTGADVWIFYSREIIVVKFRFLTIINAFLYWSTNS